MEKDNCMVNYRAWFNQICNDFDDAQLEMIKILSIAINMAKVNDKDLITYLEEQRTIIQKDIAIANDEEGKIIELADHKSN